MNSLVPFGARFLMLLPTPETAGQMVTCGREEHQSNIRAFASLESVRMLKEQMVSSCSRSIIIYIHLFHL